MSHLDAGAILEELAGQMRRRGKSGAAVIDGTFLFLGQCHEFRDRIDAELGIDREGGRRAGKIDQRFEVLLEVVRHRLVQHRIDHDRIRGDQDRVSVRLRTGGHADADIAGRASAIFDEHVGAEFFAQHRLQHAGKHVDRATGSERHEQLHRPVGPGCISATNDKRCRQSDCTRLKKAAACQGRRSRSRFHGIFSR